MQEHPKPCPLTGTDMLFILVLVLITSLWYFIEYQRRVKKREWLRHLKLPMDAIETVYLVCALAYVMWRVFLDY